MQPATILYMSNPTETHERSFDPIRQMKVQLDKLTESVGDLREDFREVATAIKGNDMGTEGFVSRIERIEERQELFEERMSTLERQSKLHRRVFKFAYTAAGALGLALLKYFGDKLFPSSVK